MAGRLTFRDIKKGDTFRIDRQRGFEDEWFYRGDWMRTDKGNLCVCLTRGNHDEGETKEWRDDLPVEMVKAAHPYARQPA